MLQYVPLCKILSHCALIWKGQGNGGMGGRGTGWGSPPPPSLIPLPLLPLPLFPTFPLCPPPLQTAAICSDVCHNGM